MHAAERDDLPAVCGQSLEPHRQQLASSRTTSACSQRRGGVHRVSADQHAEGAAARLPEAALASPSFSEGKRYTRCMQKYALRVTVRWCDAMHTQTKATRAADASYPRQ